MGSGAQMGSGARRMRARFGPGTWNPPRHTETDDNEESLEAEMADNAAEENPPRHAATEDGAGNPDADMADDTGEKNPPRHAATDHGAENLDVEVVPDAVKEQGASYDVIADEGEADAAREDGVEMSDDAEEMRAESSLEEAASVEAEDEEGGSSWEEDVGDDSAAASTQDYVQDSVRDSDQEQDCDPGSRVKGSGVKLLSWPPRRHKDWKSWLEYLDEYSEMTKQVIPIFQTMGAAERNGRLQQTKKGLDNAAQVPEDLDPYQRTYICTHGWPGRKSRGSGKRPRHHIRETDCPFRFVVQCQQRKGKWQLGVKLGHFYHNPPITGATYATYPCARGVSNALVGARVEGMLAVGAKRSKIYDYLLEHDQNVIKADVDNMVQDFASSVSSMDDNDATAAEVGVLAAADPENCVSIAETETGETGVISLSTAFMRNTFSRFGEVLLVDCTHKTNR
ncbi:hypothetical protein PR002_g19565 [Phytophthora rubi]|uniref:ZSWIM1/3 RNaseH-like domain-containing protein n=1 Tax=Phytophthora rubi TaxID=129364 RepID=A0A6A3JKT7_9STRA|nr:hypothetical protein PR002_g19565 [Phytophthora rubi]